MTTLRHRIADWISGGELTRLRNDGLLKDSAMQFSREMQMIANIGRLEARNALRAIIACKTPNANATVRRIASIAEEALEPEGPPQDGKDVILLCTAQGFDMRPGPARKNPCRCAAVAKEQVI